MRPNPAMGPRRVTQSTFVSPPSFVASFIAATSRDTRRAPDPLTSLLTRHEGPERQRPATDRRHRNRDSHLAMAKKGGAEGNSKKAAGQARKADAAAKKAAAADAENEATESAKWDKGAKSNAKK